MVDPLFFWVILTSSINDPPAILKSPGVSLPVLSIRKRMTKNKKDSPISKPFFIQNFITQG
jgi:hypothetical protein